MNISEQKKKIVRCFKNEKNKTVQHGFDATLLEPLRFQSTLYIFRKIKKFSIESIAKKKTLTLHVYVCIRKLECVCCPNVLAFLACVLWYNRVCVEKKGQKFFFCYLLIKFLSSGRLG